MLFHMRPVIAIVAAAILGLLAGPAVPHTPTFWLAALPLVSAACGVWSLNRQWTRIVTALSFSATFLLVLAARTGVAGSAGLLASLTSLALIVAARHAAPPPLASLKGTQLRH